MGRSPHAVAPRDPAAASVPDFHTRLALISAIELAAAVIAGCLWLAGGELVDARVPRAAREETTGEIVVVNQASVALGAVHLARCSTDGVGKNHLAASETIPPRASRRFVVDTTCWVVQAEAEGLRLPPAKLEVRRGTKERLVVKL